jgi:hypothetical protein
MVRRHQKLEGHALKASHRWGGCSYHQTLASFFHTRGHRAVKTVDLLKTQPARGVGMLPRLDETHIGDEDGVLQTRLEN